MQIARMSRSSRLLLTLAVLGACTPSVDGGGDWAGTRLPEPLPRPDFILRDADGEPFDFRSATEGKVTLLFFGYTHCPDICPVHMANLAAVLRDQPRELSQHIRIVFVTVDPERDTPDQLKSWLGQIDSRIVGLHGTREEVNAIELELGLPPSYVLQAEDGTVSVGHSSRVLAFGGDGPAQLSYPWGVRQKDWRMDLPKLVRETVPDASAVGR